MSNGRWVSRSLWLPAGATMEDWRSAKYTGNPLLIATESRNLGIVRNEIEAEDPDYPVWLITVGTSAYGARVRGVEVRHIFDTTRISNRYHAWLVDIQCRVDQVKVNPVKAEIEKATLEELKE